MPDCNNVTCLVIKGYGLMGGCHLGVIDEEEYGLDVMYLPTIF